MEENNDLHLSRELGQLTGKVESIEARFREAKDDIRNNQRAFEMLSTIVTDHVSKDEVRDNRLSAELKDIKVGLEDHMKEEIEYHKNRGEFEALMSQGFDRVCTLVEDMEDKVVDNGFKTKVMWSIMIAVGGGLLAMAFAIFQGFTEDKLKESYSGEQKTSYESKVAVTSGYDKLTDEGKIVIVKE